MDNRDVVALYIAEMRALLPVIQRHLETLGRADDAAPRGHAAKSVERVATALADLSVGFNVEDCAQLARAVAETFATDDEQGASLAPPAPAVLAAATDMVTFITGRVEAMADPPRLLGPTAADRAVTARLLSALVAARAPQVSLPPPARDRLPAAQSANDEKLASWDDPDVPQVAATSSPPVHSTAQANRGANEELSDDEMALTRSFGSRPLRQTNAPVSAPTTSPPLDSTERFSDDGALGGSQPGAPRMDARLAWQSTSAADLDNIPQEMRRLFIVETADDLQDLRALLLRYEEQQDDPGTMLAMGRIAHKIKGAAGTLAFDVLASLAFTFGDLLTALHTRQVAPGQDAGSVLVRGLALMQSALDAADAEVPPDPSLIARMQNLREEFFARRASPESGYQVGPLAESSMPADASDPTRSSPRHEGESYLRVDVRRLDELMSHASALAVNRAALRQTREEVERCQSEMAGSLARLTDLWTRITELAPHGSGEPGGRSGAVPSGKRSFPVTDGRAPKAPQVAEAGSGSLWDKEERERQAEFDHAMRVLSEVVADLGITGRSLRGELARTRQLGQEQAELLNQMQRDVMQIRLVPLSTLVPRLQLEVRRLATQVGKQVSFSVRGEMTEIDRNISEQLTDPLIQLVRNATVHGIEPSGERQALGKPAVGTVWLDAYYVGSEVIIEVGDDGSGVNPHILTGSAIAARVLDAETARALSPQEALDLMFLPWVTSFQSAQMVSGRGVGLDEVRTVVQSLKGSIHVRSEHGQGLVFRIRVPISLSIVRALRVGAGGQHFAVPFSAVQRTVSLSEANLVPAPPVAPVGMPGRVEQRVRIEREQSERVPGGTEHDEIPLFSLGELLGSADDAPRQLDLGLVVDAGRQRVALRVESVLADQEMVVQALPPHLRRRALRGATVTPDGQVLLLLDVPELVSGALEGAFVQPQATRNPSVGASPSAPRVLVVDDSISTRRTLEQTLGRAGFDVQVARDGIEALDLMSVSPPRVAVLDIEMPRLDGFELLAIMRGAEQLAGVQVVMLTARTSETHHEQALQLGARAYLVKPCPEDMLIETVRSLLQEPAGHS